MSCGHKTFINDNIVNSNEYSRIKTTLSIYNTLLFLAVLSQSLSLFNLQPVNRTSLCYMACRQNIHDGVHDEDDDITDLRLGCVELLNSTVEELGFSSMSKVSISALNKFKKDEMAHLLWKSLNFINEFTACTSNFRNTTSSMKTELIESQQSVIKLQAELLTCKDEQLNSLKVTVKESVEDSVKAEFKSYSSVVKKSCSDALAPRKIAAAVKSVNDKEDRSGNVIVFGVPEQENEMLESTVQDIMEHLEEKPKIAACSRIGRLGQVSGTPRPIRFSVQSSSTVFQILRKAKQLKDIDSCKSIYLCPDRTIGEREIRKKLVEQLKLKRSNDSENRYYIRQGEIACVCKD